MSDLVVAAATPIMNGAKRLSFPIIRPGDDVGFDAFVDQLEMEWDAMPPDERPVALLIDTSGAGYGVWGRLRSRRSTLPFIGLMYVLPDMSHNDQLIRLQSRSSGVRSSIPADIAYAPRRSDAPASRSP